MREGRLTEGTCVALDRGRRRGGERNLPDVSKGQSRRRCSSAKPYKGATGGMGDEGDQSRRQQGERSIPDDRAWRCVEWRGRGLTARKTEGVTVT